jgi:hypothetical protein
MTLREQSSSLFKIRIASGEHQGFYVGPASSNLLTQLTSDAERALSLHGFNYMLYTRDCDALCFGSTAAVKVQHDLRDLGIECELI